MLNLMYVYFVERALLRAGSVKMSIPRGSIRVSIDAWSYLLDLPSGNVEVALRCIFYSGGEPSRRRYEFPVDSVDLQVDPFINYLQEHLDRVPWDFDRESDFTNSIPWQRASEGMEDRTWRTPGQRRVSLSQGWERTSAYLPGIVVE